MRLGVVRVQEKPKIMTAVGAGAQAAQAYVLRASVHALLVL